MSEDRNQKANVSEEQESDLNAGTEVEEQRERLLQGVAAGKLDTLQERIAWILNHYALTRDSDVALQIQYWEHFEPDLACGDLIRKKDLFTLTRLTSIARARAKIQNTYKLFQASPGVRQHRGTLAEQEREKASDQQVDSPVFDVYADESGKTGKYLIVGSVWFLHAPEVISFLRKVRDWRSQRKFQDEFHFKAINDASLPHYLAFAEFLLGNSAVLSFKALSVERAGIKNIDKALQDMFYYLLIRGVEHENHTRRSPLPRVIQLWKDLEEPGRDKLFIAALRERLEEASLNRFNNQLAVGELRAVDSKGQVLIQAADLYVSSLNRVLNAEGGRMSSKDRFADHLLKLLGLPLGPSADESYGDMTIHASL